MSQEKIAAKDAKRIRMFTAVCSIYVLVWLAIEVGMGDGMATPAQIAVIMALIIGGSISVAVSLVR